jgi:mannose-6-phosphate isomerase-like protein (cupin superfamily)
VLAGTATVTVADIEIDVTVGDATWVPSGVPHRFANSGTEVLEIYWVYAGLNVTRTNCVTGETSDHLAPPPDLDGSEEG